MNIIDKKGMLFGKINIIDLSVVLILLFAIPMFIFSYKAMLLKEDESKKWLTVEMRITSVIPELTEAIKPEDSEVNSTNQKIGILSKIGSIVPSGTLVLTNDSTHFTLVNDPVKKDITVILSLLCNEQRGFMYYKNIPVKIGSPITFSTRMYDISGTIIRVDQTREPA